MTQPGGYCTLASCQPGNCPSESVCVTFWQDTAAGFEAAGADDDTDAGTRPAEADRNRLSTNYCMRKCDDSSDCRDDEGYACVAGDEFGQGEARVEGDLSQRFCAVR